MVFLKFFIENGEHFLMNGFDLFLGGKSMKLETVREHEITGVKHALKPGSDACGTWCRLVAHDVYDFPYPPLPGSADAVSIATFTAEVLTLLLPCEVASRYFLQGGGQGSTPKDEIGREVRHVLAPFVWRECWLGETCPMTAWKNHRYGACHAEKVDGSERIGKLTGMGQQVEGVVGWCWWVCSQRSAASP